MADKRQITDRFLRSLHPAPAGTRIEVWDTAVPGFGIRIRDTEDANPARRGKAGRIAFVLYARFKRGEASTRRTIGTYGATTLEDARRTAAEWRSSINKGVDPAIVEAEAREKREREAAALVSQRDPILLKGKPFENTRECYELLAEAVRDARYLDLIPATQPAMPTDRCGRFFANRD
jgi:hypothetical protein